MWHLQSFRGVSRLCFVKVLFLWGLTSRSCVFCPPSASTLQGGDGSEFPLYWSCWKREGDYDVYLSLPVYLCRRAGGMRTGKRQGPGLSPRLPVSFTSIACRPMCPPHLPHLQRSMSLASPESVTNAPSGLACFISCLFSTFSRSFSEMHPCCMFLALKLSQLAHWHTINRCLNC